MAVNQPVVENQFFVGVPWKDIRPKFEEAIKELREEYPVHCVVFGRNTGQDADDLWNSIQKEVQASAATIFDVTGSNPNVALEFGFAEGLGKQRVLTRYERKPRKNPTAKSRPRSDTASIMGDLAGKIRVPYKNVGALKKAMKKEFERNPYVVRFQKFFKAKRLGKRPWKVAIAAIHHLAGGKRIKKPDLILTLETQFPNMTTVDVPKLVDQLADAKLLVIKRGPQGGVRIPTV